MPLTDIAIRSAQPREKPYKMHDMLGLFLIVSPSGSKSWRMKYRQAGVEKKLSFGRYPEVSLRDARKRRDGARDQIYEGKDPARLQKLGKLRSQLLAENTFTCIAKEYWRFMRENWLSNRIFKSYHDIVNHCCFAWNRLVDQPWRIKSIGIRQWAHGF